MDTSPQSSPNEGFLRPAFIDPIISIDSVKWAARRFILVYGEAAPDVALEHVNMLDGKGRIQTAEMFERVRRECARLLRKSEHLRQAPPH